MRWLVLACLLVGGCGDDDGSLAADAAPPRLLATAPPAGAIDVATDALVEARFEPAAPAGSLTLLDRTAGSSVAGTSAPAGAAIRFTPAAALAAPRLLCAELPGVTSWCFATRAPAAQLLDAVPGVTRRGPRVAARTAAYFVEQRGEVWASHFTDRAWTPAARVADHGGAPALVAGGAAWLHTASEEVWAAIESDGVFSAAQRVGGGAGSSAGAPGIAAGGSERLVFWSEGVPGSKRWMAASFAAGAWGAAAVLPFATGDASALALGFDGSGRVLAVWQQSAGASTQIHWSRREGGTWSAAATIPGAPSTSAFSPRLVVAPGGAAVVVWEQLGADIWAAGFDGSAWLTPERLRVNLISDGVGLRIARDPTSGDVVAAWTQEIAGRQAVWATRRSGTTWSTAEMLAEDPAGVSDLRVAPGRLIWRGSGGVVMGRRWTGTMWAPPERAFAAALGAGATLEIGSAGDVVIAGGAAAFAGEPSAVVVEGP